jgi:hypothetical protein
MTSENHTIGYTPCLCHMGEPKAALELGFLVACITFPYSSVITPPLTPHPLPHSLLSMQGTWISDVATYMTQPNRPGRDMVVSPRSAAVASLVLACMAASDPATSSAARNRLLVGDSPGERELAGA